MCEHTKCILSNCMTRACKHGESPRTKTQQKTYLQLFLVTNSLNLCRDPIRHNGVVIWVSSCFPGTSCVFVISWQWYYDWWARGHIMGTTGEEQWGNLDLHMFRPLLAADEMLHKRPKASNWVPIWRFIQWRMLHLPPKSLIRSRLSFKWGTFIMNSWGGCD